MHLLEPLTLAARELKNRVVFGPIPTNLGDGRTFSKRHVAFYEARAAGGCGLIVTEQISVHGSDWPYERCPSADEAAAGLADIAEVCHHHGAVVVAGLSHAGGQSTSAFSQRELWAPSDEPDVNTREVPKIMERSDIAEVVSGFASTAGMAIAAGLDGIELNAGQFSLIRQFLSGLTNRRDDGFGQDRSLFARQVLTAVRDSIGADHILGLRLSCDELAPWAGITPEAAAELAVQFAPFVDYLTVVRGGIFSAAETRPTAQHSPGFNLDLAAQVRSAIAGAVQEGVLDGPVPVFVQGSIISVDQAGQAIADGRCDAVEMTRAQLADAQLVANTAAGRSVRPCVLCNQLCNVRDNRNPIISCIADPRCGHETTDPIEPPPSRPVKVGGSADVLVVGGGPAGLEAARVAARNGLSVALHERSPDLGGMAATAAVAPAHRPLAELVRWLVDDAEHHVVAIHRNSTIDAEQVLAFPGKVIIAAGSVRGHRQYTVDDKATVVDVADVLLAAADDDLDVLLTQADRATDGDDDGHRGSPVIWDPIGGSVGVAVAELLAAAGRTVTLVTPDAVAANMLALTGDMAGANTRLQQAGVTILRRQRLVAVDPGGIVVDHVFTGERTTVPAAVVVDVSARGPNEELWEATGRAMTRVGDAVAPRTVAEAIREGRAAAVALTARPGRHP